MALLLREAIGERLRQARVGQRRTLREVSRIARVSLGYLSEVERGRKEPSSELLAAICAALELPLEELLRWVASDLSTAIPDTASGVVPMPDTVPGDITEPVAMVSATVEGGRLVRTAPGGSGNGLPAESVIPRRLVTGTGEVQARARVAA